jgi:hypothetical protein
MKEHNGTIEAANSPGGGAVFTVTLPVQRAKRLIGFSKLALSEAPRNSRRNLYRSTAIATAFPPPRHRAAIPRFASRRIIS